MNSITSAFILIFSVSIVGFGQTSRKTDCNQWVMTKRDSASGTQSFTARNVLMVSDDHEKTGLNIYSFLNSSGKVVVMSIQAVGAGKCVDKGDKINILFTDGEEIELSNTNDFNCDGSATIYFGGALGKKDVLNLLAEKQIKTMRVWTRDDYLQRTFTEHDATQFRSTTFCLTSLLKE